MMLIPADTDYKGNVMGTYRQLLDEAHGASVSVESMPREQFYERASKAFAVVATSDSARFANIIIRKGVVRIGEED
jgi:L-fucose mutarotase